jgi:hypothetical protein
MRPDAIGVGLQYARDEHDTRLGTAEERVGVDAHVVLVEPHAQLCEVARATARP